MPSRDTWTLSTDDGYEIAVHALGEGTPVVLLHGATLDGAWNWERPGIAHAIVDGGYRAVMPDLRGHGASSKPLDANAMSLKHLVDDVGLVLDALNVEKAPLIGYSLGSVVALEAATVDARVQSVVAGGLALEIIQPDPLPPDREAYLDQLAADRDEDVTDPQAQQVRAWDRSQGSDPRARAALIRALRLPRPVDLGSVVAPVLVVNGADDHAPDSLVASLPHARAARVKGDHSSALDDPALAAFIVDFLRTSR